MNAVDRRTPTGVLVCTSEPETPEWFAARRAGITGTDLPKILGLSKYGNSLSVWLKKRGETEEPAGEAARWGQLLEDIVGQEWARRHETGIEPVGVLAHVDEPWKRASLDRLVTACPDETDDRAALAPGSPRCGLEIKTRSAYKRGSWKDKEPDDVLAQVSWGLLVTGLDHMHIAVLIGGQELLSFRVDRDEALEQYLVDAAKPVWDAVLSGDPPPSHPDADGVLLEQLNKIYVKREGERELPAEAQDLLASYRSAGNVMRELKREQTVAKSALIQMLDDGDTGVVDGVPQFTYLTADPSDTVTADSLRAFRAENPELYDALKAEGLITTTTPSPRFNLKARKA